MAKRSNSPTGTPCWIDVTTSDANRARSFYSELFGWKATEPSAEFGGYFQFEKDGAPVAGGMQKMPDNPMPDVWSTYIHVADAGATLEKAAKLDAEILVPAMQVGDLGTMAVFKDPGDAAIGIWSPINFQGFGAYDEPNAPRYFELQTRSYDTAVSFYSELFEWDTKVQSDSPEFQYTTISTASNNGEDFAGIMNAVGHLPDSVPSHWTVYFGVENADDTIVTATRLGGSVVVPAQDTPYGRLATVADPCGALFNIIA